MTAVRDHPAFRLLLDDEIRDPLLDIAVGPALLHLAGRSGGPGQGHGTGSGNGSGTGSGNGPGDRSGDGARHSAGQSAGRFQLPVLRMYRPAPTVAFSGRDCAAAGIGRAAAAALSRGFIPVRRGAGGRAVAYHGGALCIDHVSPDGAGNGSIARRFAFFGSVYRATLRGLGVGSAAVGEVPGEYCPGEYSVNDGHGHKLIGTAQRLVPGAWMFSAVVVISDPDPLREVLAAVYAELDIRWDPATVGAIDRAVPGIGPAEVERALLSAYVDAYSDPCAGEDSGTSDVRPSRQSVTGPPHPEPLPASVVELARSRADRHRVPER